MENTPTCAVEERNVQHGQQGAPKEPGHNGTCRTQIDAAVDQYAHEVSAALSEVFLGEDRHRVVEDEHIVHAALLGAFTLVVDNA